MPLRTQHKCGWKEHHDVWKCSQIVLNTELHWSQVVVIFRPRHFNERSGQHELPCSYCHWCHCRDRHGQQTPAAKPRSTTCLLSPTHLWPRDTGVASTLTQRPCFHMYVFACNWSVADESRSDVGVVQLHGSNFQKSLDNWQNSCICFCFPLSHCPFLFPSKLKFSVQTTETNQNLKSAWAIPCFFIYSWFTWKFVCEKNPKQFCTFVRKKVSSYCWGPLTTQQALVCVPQGRFVWPVTGTSLNSPLATCQPSPMWVGVNQIRPTGHKPRSGACEKGNRSFLYKAFTIDSTHVNFIK